MKTLYFLRGLPASGKTTWALEKLATLNKNGKSCVVRTNKDEIRKELGEEGKSSENEVISREIGLVTNALEAGMDVIVDNTHLHPPHELRYRQLAQNYGYKFVLKSFTHVPLLECIRRDKTRANPVGALAIRRMYAQYLNLKENSRTIERSKK
jgi:predicted kinase